MLHLRFARQHFETDASDPRSRSREVCVDQIFVQSDGLENLRAAVALQRGNAHLRKGLQQAFVDGLHEVLDRFVPGVFHRADSRAMPDPPASR